MMSAENSASPTSLALDKCAVVLVDVAGTTTSINFVKDELFPFVNKEVEEFLKTQWEEETVKQAVKELKDGEELDVSKASELVKSLTEQQDENKGLKTIQGLIYKKGYESGNLKGHVFDDVPESFENWAKHREVSIYSTGSVESQKLLFSNTSKGDLSQHISKYFDQSVGSKTDSESYKKIANQLKITAEEIVFVTDNIEEAKAAKGAGVIAVLITREGNSEIPEGNSKEFNVISSFNELVFENSAKRKGDDEPLISEAPPKKVPKTDELVDIKSDDKIEKKSTEPETLVEKKEITESEQVMEVDPLENEEKKDQIDKETATIETDIPKSDTKEKVPDSDTAKSNDQMEADIIDEIVPEKEVSEEVKTQEDEVKPTDDVNNKTVKNDEKKPTTDCGETQLEVEKATTQIDDEDKTLETTGKLLGESTETTGESEEVPIKTDERSMDENKEKDADKVADTKDDEEKTEDVTVGKVEEKENKSVLANGVENGTTDADDANGIEEKAVDEADLKKDEPEETEVKVKKLEETTDSKTVSVEV